MNKSPGAIGCSVVWNGWVRPPSGRWAERRPNLGQAVADMDILVVDGNCERGGCARLSSVVVAMREGEQLPPIETYAWRGEYYVLDGHHRVAAARAVGSDLINAHVIEVG